MEHAIIRTRRFCTAIALAGFLGATGFWPAPITAADHRPPSPQLLAQQFPGGKLRRGKDGRLELVPAPATEAPDDQIVLPEPLAVELPPGVTRLAPDALPLSAVLGAAKAGASRVTHDLKQPVGSGLHRVTWTAWDGAPGASGVRQRKSAVLFVLPAGQAPVGVSGSTHATAGNNSVKIVRDAEGRVHMAWLDSGRPGRPSAVMYRRAATAPATGAVTWETPPIRVNDGRSEAANTYLGIAASARAVHFVWQARGSARYRRLRHTSDGWAFERIRDTAVPSEGHDVGPAIAAASDEEIHIVTPVGGYGLSQDGGARWLRGTVPIPRGMRSKTVTIALDSNGNAHVAYTGIVRGPAHPSEARASDGYWELRYARRAAGGSWVDVHNALAGLREWAEPTDGDDVLADWIGLAADAQGNLHAVWHGTANTRIYGNDQPFYARRDASGPGAWQRRWSTPEVLYRTDRSKGERFAYAPSLSLDGATAVAVTFYEVLDGGRTIGFDTVARLVRGGAVVGAPIPLLQTVRKAAESGRIDQALSSWFPSAAPRIHRTPDGRAWLDVLNTLEPAQATGAPNLIVYQRVDITDALARAH